MFDQQLLPAGCNGNLTVLNLLSACVSDQKSAFLPLQEKLCVGSKNDWHLLVLELSRRSLSACKVWGGEIELRAPAVGAKIRVFLYVTLGLPAHGGHSSNKYCVTVYGSILTPFSAIFQKVSSIRCITWFSFMSPGWATIFAKLPSKITKSPKLAEKFVRTTSYR